MKKICVVILATLALSSVPFSASAATKCALEKRQYDKATRDADKAAANVERLTTDYTNRSTRGDEQTARLQSRISDADGAITGGHINLVGDALACWQSQQRNCSGRTAQNAARRYANAVARLEKAKGTLKAFQESLARVLKTLSDRITRANGQLAEKQKAQKAAEDALKACMG